MTLKPITCRIYDALIKAARQGLPCPSNHDLALTAGINTPHVASKHVKMIEDEGLIRVERYRTARRVHIVGTPYATAEVSGFRTRQNRHELLDELAERVSEGETLVSAARSMGVAENTVTNWWREIKDGLGWQAHG